MAESLRQGCQQLESQCPEGERWVCFTIALHGEAQDLVKEQAVRQQSMYSHLTPGPIQHEDLYTELKQQLENQTEIPRLGKNLFVDLGERISRELNVTNCWVWGGIMTEEWPWKGSSLGLVEILKWNRTNIKGES